MKRTMKAMVATVIVLTLGSSAWAARFDLFLIQQHQSDCRIGCNVQCDHRHWGK